MVFAILLVCALVAFPNVVFSQQPQFDSDNSALAARTVIEGVGPSVPDLSPRSRPYSISFGRRGPIVPAKRPKQKPHKSPSNVSKKPSKKKSPKKKAVNRAPVKPKKSHAAAKAGKKSKSGSSASISKSKPRKTSSSLGHKKSHKSSSVAKPKRKAKSSSVTKPKHRKPHSSVGKSKPSKTRGKGLGKKKPKKQGRKKPSKKGGRKTKKPKKGRNQPRSKLPAYAREALRVHNAFRKKHGAKPLKWNAKIAAGATEYAKKCRFEHSGIPSLGENLALGSTSFTNLFNMWTAEAAQYNPANPIYSHFTQVVWKSSTELGCSYYNCKNGATAPTWSMPGPVRYVVCRYNPPGNYVGQFGANVQP